MHPTFVASNKVTLQTDTWLYGVHRTCTKMAAVSYGMSHVNNSTVSVTTLVDIQKSLCKVAFTHSESHKTRAQWVLVGENSGTVLI